MHHGTINLFYSLYIHCILIFFISLLVDLRTIGVASSPLIVDRTPPTAGTVNDGPTTGVDLAYTKEVNQVVYKFSQ